MIVQCCFIFSNLILLSVIGGRLCLACVLSAFISNFVLTEHSFRGCADVIRITSSTGRFDAQNGKTVGKNGLKSMRAEEINSPNENEKIKARFSSCLFLNPSFSLSISLSLHNSVFLLPMQCFDCGRRFNKNIAHLLSPLSYIYCTIFAFFGL